MPSASPKQRLCGGSASLKFEVENMHAFSQPETQTVWWFSQPRIGDDNLFRPASIPGLGNLQALTASASLKRSCLGVGSIGIGAQRNVDRGPAMIF